jgi:fused signal recognition particle receptor
VKATSEVIESLREQHAYGMVQTPADVRAEIRRRLLGILERRSARPGQPPSGQQVWMIVGVNGTGKTTTVGKLASRLQGEGKKVLICAADTFRPAAIEQLAVWAERSGVEMVKNRAGSDPSAVLHDALSAAEARRTDVVLVDTAGRLHTKSNLMQELEKMRRVAARKVGGAPHEVLLVLDATTGQNGLSQAREFLRATGVTGLVVTKLDGTAKGGVLFGIAEDLKIPVRYVGIGESIEDLVEFDPAVFVDSLFADTRQ